VWFKHRAWVPIAWFLCVGNLAGAWFAALPAEPWHATTHALFAVLFGLGAQRLTDRQRALKTGGGGAELTTDSTLREQLAALRQADSQNLERLEQGVTAIAIELERVGEGQRFLTKVLTESPRNLEISPRSPQPDSGALLRRPRPDEE